ncbi:MAG: LysE family transporter [Planctomycetes bacterium]|nr:LysE family transporter [Planctomycetota bacterium]
MELLVFLAGAVVISLSGVMAPGSVTAAAIAHGSRSKNAGALIALGHGIIEIPLIFLIMFGLSVLFEAMAFRITVGLIGGSFLVWMGAEMLRQMNKADCEPERTSAAGAVVTGLVLSATNPYFLLWWASVGLNLALQARKLGIIAFVLFALVHWLCDLIWLSLLSMASFKGSTLIGPKNRTYLLAFCATALIVFGVKFIHDAAALAAFLIWW